VPQFVVIGKGQWPSTKPGAWTLQHDSWDDFGFKTMFHLHLGLGDDSTEIGTIKIAHTGMGEGGRTQLDPRFSRLDPERYFSLGQDPEFYSYLRDRVGSSEATEILTSLGDIALDLHRLRLFDAEPVLGTSLLRNVEINSIQLQFHRIAIGAAPLTHYQFLYEFPNSSASELPTLDIRVVANSTPPTNVHALIGSNGVGKTTFLGNLVRSLRSGNDGSNSWGRVVNGSSEKGIPPFTNIVMVSFSAFDPFDAAFDADPDSNDFGYEYVGLRSTTDRGRLMSDTDLTNAFVASVRSCSKGARRNRWSAAVQTLALDPLLRESGITDLLQGRQISAVDEGLAAEVFRSLSSGHKIAMLTVTRLVELVQERSLVLIDELEAHLHPPLLSKLVRVISELMENRNGVAIVATHSPIVLQEVPRAASHVLRRSGDRIRVDGLPIESFGEGIGRLTAAVFGLEVTQSGFHQMLRRAAEDSEGSFEVAVDYFGGQLGSEGRAILRALMAEGRRR
jgi:hypothetical protein